MSKSSHGHPNVGSLVRDTAKDRFGIYMGQGGPYAMLRPVGGGKEWQADPGDLEREVSAYPRPADVAQLQAAHRYHVAECTTCTPDVPCDIGRVLALACEEATRSAESATQAEAS